MYSVAIKKDFKAKHFLPEAKGEESEIHVHDYSVEIRIYGQELNEKGYLIDLNEVEEHLKSCLNDFEGKVLNELEYFENRLPTIENFAYTFWKKICEGLDKECLTSLEVKLWEKESAFASYENDL